MYLTIRPFVFCRKNMSRIRRCRRSKFSTGFDARMYIDSPWPEDTIQVLDPEIKWNRRSCSSPGIQVIFVASPHEAIRSVKLDKYGSTSFRSAARVITRIHLSLPPE